MKKVLLNLDLVEKDYFGLQFMDTKQVPVSICTNIITIFLFHFVLIVLSM